MGENTEETMPNDASPRDPLTPDSLHDHSPYRPSQTTLNRPNMFSSYTPRTPSRPQPSSSSESEAAQTLTMMASTRSPKDTTRPAQCMSPTAETVIVRPFTDSFLTPRNTPIDMSKSTPNQDTSHIRRGLERPQLVTQMSASPMNGRAAQVSRPLEQTAANATSNSTVPVFSEASQRTANDFPISVPRDPTGPLPPQSSDRDMVQPLRPLSSLQQLNQMLAIVTPGLVRDAEGLKKRVERTQSRIKLTSNASAKLRRSALYDLVLELSAIASESRLLNKQYMNHKIVLRTLSDMVRDNQAADFRRIVIECKDMVLDKLHALKENNHKFAAVYARFNAWNEQDSKANDEYNIATGELQAYRDEHRGFLDIVKQVQTIQASLAKQAGLFPSKQTT